MISALPKLLVKKASVISIRNKILGTIANRICVVFLVVRAGVQCMPLKNDAISPAYISCTSAATRIMRMSAVDIIRPVQAIKDRAPAYPRIL